MYAAIGGALTAARNSGASFRKPAKNSAVEGA
jgi:hypothetical protein